MGQQLRYDLLGSIKYQKAALKGCRKESCISVLHNYFERGARKHFAWYRKILEHPKNFSLVVHGIWHNDHRFSASDKPKAMRVGKQLNRIAKFFPNRVFFSPFLERGNPGTYVGATFQELKDYKHLRLVNSFTQSGYQPLGLSGVIDEVHNTDFDQFSYPYMFSTDGRDARDAPIVQWKARHSHALMFGLWSYVFNGKDSLHDRTPPRERDNWPKAKFIRQIGRLY